MIEKGWFEERYESLKIIDQELKNKGKTEGEAS